MIFKEDIFATPKLLTKLLNEGKKKRIWKLWGRNFKYSFPEYAIPDEASSTFTSESD